jgi:hypothetical protein
LKIEIDFTPRWVDDAGAATITVVPAVLIVPCPSPGVNAVVVMSTYDTA